MKIPGGELIPGGDGESPWGCLFQVMAPLFVLVLITDGCEGRCSRSKQSEAAKSTKTYFEPSRSSPTPSVQIPDTPTPSPSTRRTFPAPSPVQPHNRVQTGAMFYVVKVAQDDPDQLNVRAGPGQGYASIGSIPWNGKRIEYLGGNEHNESDLWVKIRWGDVVGWVHSTYLSREQ